jgi:hypothetical protein
MSRPRYSTAAVGLLVVPLLVVGCTQTQKPFPTNDASDFGPPPKPTPFQITCTPLAGTGTPTPCTQAEYDALRQKKADYAAAEKVYRAFFDEDVKLLKSGGVATPEIRLLLAGPMVDQYDKDKQRQHDAGITGVGEVTLAYTRPSAVALREGSEVALDVCKDGSNVTAYRNGQAAGNASIVKGHVFLSKVDGAFRIWWIDGEVVGSC